MRFRREVRAWREGREPHRNGRPPMPADLRAKTIRRGLRTERREFERAMRGWQGQEGATIDTVSLGDGARGGVRIAQNEDSDL